MKEKFTKFNNLDEFDALDEGRKDGEMKRAAALGMLDTRYCHEYITLSDLDGKGWYFGRYLKLPHLGKNGTTYCKVKCTESITYKAGKTWSNGVSIRQLLRALSDNVRDFEWVQSIRCVIPEYAVRAILDRKITSCEGLWKLIAKRSYHTDKWKVVRYCMEQRLSFFMLNQVVTNIDALNDDKTGGAYYTLDQLVRYAIVFQEKISCTWSEHRMQEELERLRRKVEYNKLLSMPDIRVWDSEGWEEAVFGPAFEDSTQHFRLIDSARLAFDTSGRFSNCVYRCYWHEIERNKYLVFASEDICIGFRVLSDWDVMLDQCRGKRNAPVKNEKHWAEALRPIAQMIVDKWRKEHPDATPNGFRYHDDELPY